VGEHRAELIVVEELDAGGGEVVLEALEVLVGRAGAAVQEQQLDPRVGAEPLGPHLEIAFRRVDRNHLDPRGLQAGLRFEVASQRRLLRRAGGEAEHRCTGEEHRTRHGYARTPKLGAIPAPSPKTTAAAAWAAAGLAVVGGQRAKQSLDYWFVIE